MRINDNNCVDKAENVIFTIRFLQNLQKNWMMRFVEELSIFECVLCMNVGENLK